MRSWTQAVRERVSLPALPNVHPGKQTLDEGTTIRAKYAAVSIKAALCVSLVVAPPDEELFSLLVPGVCLPVGALVEGPAACPRR